MHQITSKANAFYESAASWPGPDTVADPKTPNERAYNTIFSVFVQEMLHLQLAANMAACVFKSWPAHAFTSPALMSPVTHGWTCFGPDKTVIPHIIDLKDTISQKATRVNTAALSATQLQLFYAIEQPDEVARADIEPDKIHDYFPTVPFATWQPGQPLPMFGTIGWMYQCYFDYLNLKYADGTTLWELVFNSNGQQNDQFNNFASGHPMREFMGFEATVAQTYPEIAFAQMGMMMDAITDQGEGSTLKEKLRFARGFNLLAVEPQYQASVVAMESDYPTFSDTGKLEPSADAVARGQNDINDHYECFKEIGSYVDKVVTWEAWLKAHGPWTAADLTTPSYTPPENAQIPPPADVAQALNALTKVIPGGPDYYELLSQASVGSIAGVTTVLDSYWNAKTQAASPVSFPFPSMSGSGDRMAICWAVFGKSPDLAMGVTPPVNGVLYHSCQGIDFNLAGGAIGTNSCAEVTVFHTCKGSNGCRAQGGCGFVQKVTGGGNCSSGGGGGGGCSTATAGATRQVGTLGGGCNPFSGPAVSAPGDNKCGTFGGCAVPISASQLYPTTGNMQLFKYVKKDGDWSSEPVGNGINYAKGDNVHDIAWKAYFEVMQPGGTMPPPPKPTTIRLAFPPST